MILVPYTSRSGTNGQSLSPETVRLLDDHSADQDITWVEIDPDDRLQYSRVLVEAWGWPDDLIIVEHDIGVPPGFVHGFRDCRQPWCGHAYAVGDQMLCCLGCIRFTAELKLAEPDLMSAAAAIGSEQDGGGVIAGAWQRMDIRIAACLERRGYTRHLHTPDAQHFHWYPRAVAVADA